MDNIVIEPELFAGFCEHLSAGINVLELINTTRALNATNFSAARDDPILFMIADEAIQTTLVALRYPAFLQECARNLRLLDRCRDIFLSELDQEMFELFVQGFEHVSPRITVESVERGIVVHVPTLLSDAVLPVLGRVHWEVLQTLEQFQKLVAAVSGDPTRLFLNAKASTPESQYIQLWVALQLRIPLQTGTGGVTRVV